MEETGGPPWLSLDFTSSTTTQPAQSLDPYAIPEPSTMSPAGAHALLRLALSLASAPPRVLFTRLASPAPAGRWLGHGREVPVLGRHWLSPGG